MKNVVLLLLAAVALILLVGVAPGVMPHARGWPVDELRIVSFQEDGTPEIVSLVPIDEGWTDRGCYQVTLIRHRVDDTYNPGVPPPTTGSRRPPPKPDFKAYKYGGINVTADIHFNDTPPGVVDIDLDGLLGNCGN